jgi:hypothetical protein
MYWFLELLEELGIERQVGHPTEIRAAEPRNTCNSLRQGKNLGGRSLIYAQCNN